jgi:hypothetical protein
MWNFCNLMLSSSVLLNIACYNVEQLDVAVCKCVCVCVCADHPNAHPNPKVLAVCPTVRCGAVKAELDGWSPTVRG